MGRRCDRVWVEQDMMGTVSRVCIGHNGESMRWGALGKRCNGVWVVGRKHDVTGRRHDRV